MDILGKLFSSNALVKIMRLFLLNSETAFENKDIILKSKVSASALRTEISILDSIKFIKRKNFYKEVPVKTKSTKSKKKTNSVPKTKKKRVTGWQLNPEFQYLQQIKSLLVNSVSVDRKNILQRLKGTGKIKLIILSGIFIREDNSTVDMLIVGDNLKKKQFDNALQTIESEMGKDIKYAVLDTKEFNYRLGVYDKFVRDILDYSHEKLLDKIGIK
jgi:hypothetical protein